MTRLDRFTGKPMPILPLPQSWGASEIPPLDDDAGDAYRDAGHGYSQGWRNPAPIRSGATFNDTQPAEDLSEPSPKRSRTILFVICVLLIAGTFLGVALLNMLPGATR